MKKGKSNNFGQKKNVAQNNNAGLFGTSPKPTPTPIPLGTTISLGGPLNDQVLVSLTTTTTKTTTA